MADIQIKPITPEESKQIKFWILQKHYIRRWPTAVRYKLGVYVDGKLSGTLLYGVPLRAQSATDLFEADGKPIMQNNQVLELLRAYTTDEVKTQVPNLGSIVISKGNKFITDFGKSIDDKPIKVILSYADPEAGHLGAVYKATNAKYLGTQRESKVLTVTDPKTGAGIEVHPMSLKRFGTSDIEKLRAEPLFKGKVLNWEARSGKHKYLYPLGKSEKERNQLMSHLKVPLFSYPEKGVEPHEIPNPAKNIKPIQQTPKKSEPQDKKSIIKQLLRSKVYNPETKRKILVKTALGYEKNHPSYQQAKGMVNAFSKKHNLSLS